MKFWTRLFFWVAFVSLAKKEQGGGGGGGGGGVGGLNLQKGKRRR